MEPFVAEIVGSCPSGAERSAPRIKWNGDVAIGLELRRRKVFRLWSCANYQRTFLIAGHEMGDRAKPRSLILWEKIASALEAEVDHLGITTWSIDVCREAVGMGGEEVQLQAVYGLL